MLTLSLNRESRTPLQLQIFQFYFQAIQQGDLLCGDKLPSIREQAQTLNVAKITIVMAYEKLMTAGFIKSRQGIGYEVIFTAPVRSPPTHVTSAEGSPPVKPKPAGASTDVYGEMGREFYCQVGENGIMLPVYLRNNCLLVIIHQMDYFHYVIKWSDTLIYPEVLILVQRTSLLPMGFRKDYLCLAKYLLFIMLYHRKKSVML